MVKLDKLWHMQMSLTTFILAFFLNCSQAVWSDMVLLCRKIQGRLNDVSIVASSHAMRDSATGLVTPEAQAVLDTIARYKRLFSVTFYSSIVRSHAKLQTDDALAGMQSRGLITPIERDLLAGMPPAARHHAVVQWLYHLLVGACSRDDIFRQPSIVCDTVCDKITQLRASYGAVPDKVRERGRGGGGAKEGFERGSEREPARLRKWEGGRVRGGGVSVPASCPRPSRLAASTSRPSTFKQPSSSHRLLFVVFFFSPFRSPTECRWHTRILCMCWWTAS